MGSHYKNEKQKRDGLADLARWKKIHMKDPKYREDLARRQRERMDALRRDAEFGRIARTMLQYLGEMIAGVGKEARPLTIKYEHPSAADVLFALKRPFTPEQATEYMELLKIKDEMENKKNGGSKGRKKRAR